MIPLIIAAIGGYFIGDGLVKPLFAKGGETPTPDNEGERIGDYWILKNADGNGGSFASAKEGGMPFYVVNREGACTYKAESLQDARDWAIERTDNVMTCPTCGGSGECFISCCTGEVVNNDLQMCPVCHEHLGEEECPSCHGSGVVPLDFVEEVSKAPVFNEDNDEFAKGGETPKRKLVIDATVGRGMSISPLAEKILNHGMRMNAINSKQATENDIRLAAEEVAYYHKDDEEIGSSDWTFIMKEFLDGIGYETYWNDKDRLEWKPPTKKRRE